ncbi:hypothetical protein GGH96_006132 [Coemansia sp. RSA 1972]|nr:hypothetical protein GGH96_006132 [Coemansia sp. RSA 1972]
MFRVIGSFSALRVSSRVLTPSRAFSTTGASLVAAAKPKRKTAAAVKKTTKSKAPVKAKKAKKVKAAPKPKPKPKKKAPSKKEQLDAMLSSKRALLKAPKSRAPGAYAVFLGEFSKVKRQQGMTTVAEIARACSANWKQLGESEKHQYQAKADQLGAEYEETLRKWWNTTDHNLVALENRRRKRVDGDKARLLKDPFAPKRPMTSYVLFVKDFVTQNKGAAGTNDITEMSSLMKSAASKWKTLSSAEKAPYAKGAEVEKSRYQQDQDKYLKSHTVGGARLH